MNPSLWVVIPSAGKGSRFGGPVPKQYQTFLDATVLQYTLGRFLCRDDIAAIMVVVAPGDTFARTLVASDKVHFVKGGQERSDSVFNALCYLESRAASNDLVVVHDAARPCVRKSSLDRLFAAAQTSASGAILAQPVNDTVKLVQSGAIEKTIDRNRVWLAQTPQVFPLAMLLAALRHSRERCLPVTDEASAVELSGYKPLVVAGNSENIKITSSGDLDTASFFMKKILQEQD